jgi:hypothetical protein
MEYHLAHCSKLANTEEALAKKKSTFKNIKHQQGKSNSQYGTCWVYNEKLENKKIKLECLEQYLLSGWVKGRRVNPVQKSKLKEKS